MGFKITDCYQNAIEKDFSRKHQLRVISIGGQLGPEDNVFITTANLPGYTIHNVQTPFMGMNFNIPGTGRYPGSDNWAVTFRCDLNLDIRSILEGWQRKIFTAIENDGVDGAVPGSTGYYHIPDTSQNILLGLHDREGSFYRKYELVGCYPKTVGEMQYDQTDAGTIATFNCNLAYQYWTLDAANASDARMPMGMAVNRSQL